MKRCPICQTTFNDEANFCPMDAGRLVAVEAPVSTPPAPSQGNDKLLGGRFTMGAPLGGGNTGEVFTARDEQTGASVVVKVVSPKVFPTPMAAQRTERELKLLPKVASERVARVLDSGKTSTGQIWVAMEMVNGVPLAEVVAANGPLPTSQALKYALEVGEALAEAAKVGVIHRDVSPKNVLVTDGDHVKVLNFSLPMPVTDKVFGVAEFLSPEQAEGKPVDQRSNIYGLAALTYFMVTGEPPFSGDTASVLQQVTKATAPPLAHRTPGIVVTMDLERCLMKALEKQSSRRHLTLRQLLGELEALASGQPVPRTNPPYAPIAGAGASGAGSSYDPLILPKKSTQPPAEPSPATTLPGHPVFAKDGKEARTAEMHTAPPPEPQFPGAHPAGPPPAGPPWVTGQNESYAQQGAPVEIHSAPTAPAPPPMVAPPVAAPPPPLAQVAPPSPPPSVVSPTAPAAAVGKKGKAQPEPDSRRRKGKFRETMWFKKGELDEAAAHTAATQPAQGGIPLDKADELPIEDRYKDDGTLSSRDRERLSLKTGNTQMMQAIRDAPRPSASGAMDERELAKEVTGGRGLVIGIIVGVVVLGGIIAAVLALK